MREEDLLNLEKGDLVQLFYKYVTPLPQRLHQLRRAKRLTPCGKSGESTSSKGRTPKVIRLTKRKSDEIVTTTPIKIARTEHKNSININKNPAYIDSINKGINSVAINATSPTTNTGTSHERNTLNKAVKPKVVKLNRTTLGLHVDKSFEHSLLKDESKSSLNGGTEKESAASMSSGESGSDVNDTEIRNTKRKFEKIAVTWP